MASSRDKISMSFILEPKYSTVEKQQSTTITMKRSLKQKVGNNVKKILPSLKLSIKRNKHRAEDELQREALLPQGLYNYCYMKRTVLLAKFIVYIIDLINDREYLVR
jgi:hypothetical protein